MTLLEKLNIVKGEFEQLSYRLRSLCNCDVSDIVFGIRLGMITEQLKDLSGNYVKSVNEFEADESISMSIYNNIQAAIHSLFHACEDKQSSYCFCIGVAHNYIATGIIELDNWIVSIELS